MGFRESFIPRDRVISNPRRVLLCRNRRGPFRAIIFRARRSDSRSMGVENRLSITRPDRGLTIKRGAVVG